MCRALNNQERWFPARAVAAWCQPFQSRAANLFKVATEVTLLLTLIIAGMLRVEVTNGKMPPILLNRDETGIDEDSIGLLLFLANTIVPGASLIIGWFGIGFDVSEAATAAKELAFDFQEFDNPVSVDNESPTFDQEFDNPVSVDNEGPTLDQMQGTE
jgi:hypothetical protein